MIDYLGSIMSFTEKKKRIQKTSGNWSNESPIYDGYSKNTPPKIPKISLLHLFQLIKVHPHHLWLHDQGQKLLLLHKRSSALLLATVFLHATVYQYRFHLHQRLISTYFCRFAVVDGSEILHRGLNSLSITYTQHIHTLQKLILFYPVFFLRSFQVLTKFS